MMLRRFVVAAAGAAALWPSVAQAQVPPESFACRASAWRTAAGEPTVANRARTPCRAESRGPASTVIPVVPGVTLTVRGATAQTTVSRIDAFDYDYVEATASVASARLAIGLIGVNVPALRADASAGCQSGNSFVTSGSSMTGGFFFDPQIYPTPGPGPSVLLRDPVSIPLGIGTLHLNRRLQVGRDVVVRALELDLAGTADDVVVGEARAGSTVASC